MRHSPNALMLFAAGFGTRMGPLTQDRPKPLVTVAGQPLVDYALALAHGAAIQKIVANVHYRAPQMAAHLAARNVMISDESSEILETGGGLRQALPLLGSGPVFTLNTDAIWTGPNILTALDQHWQNQPAPCHGLLALVPAERAIGHSGPGDFSLAPDGRLTRGPGYVYTGAQIICPEALAQIPKKVFSLNLLWDILLSQGSLRGYVHEGGWCDVGRPESIPLAETMLADARSLPLPSQPFVQP